MKFSWDKFIPSSETISMDFGVSKKYVGVIILVTTIAAIFVAWQFVPAGLLLLLLGFFYAFYIHKAKHYALTNKKIYLADSFIGSHIISVDYSQITEIEVVESFADQLAGWGSLLIHTAGTHSLIKNVSFIENPHAVKKMIDEIKAISS